MRASRLLSMLFLLQIHQHITAQELADALEVSLRTVYRDVDSLNEAGIPVIATRGPTGGYQLLEGYRTRPIGLTKDEAAALILASVPTSAANLGFGDVVNMAHLKLIAALPEHIRTNTEHLRKRFHVDTTPWYRTTDQPPLLVELAAAVWSQQAIEVEYQRWEGLIKRKLEPLGIVQKDSLWYVIARSEQGIRTYRVSSIQTLVIFEESFDWPPGFNLIAYWREWIQQFEARLHQDETTVRLAPRAFMRLGDFFPPSVVVAAQASVTPADSNGWVTVIIPIESVEQAARDLLRLGVEAEVLSPEPVRQRITEILRQLQSMYEATT